MKEKIKAFIDKNNRILMPAFLFLGFIVDSLTLTRVDQVFDNLVLLFYLVLAGVSIFFFHVDVTEEKKVFSKLKKVSPFSMQYAFGGLFSGLVIFYMRSSSFVTSFPFLIILLILFIGNDFLHNKYQKLFFQISVFYIAIFSYSILIVPVILRKMGTSTFIISSVLSLILVFAFIRSLGFFGIKKIKELNFYKTIGSILAFFVILYITNVIPPIPLSLKESYVAHNVEKIINTSENSRVTYDITLQKNPWYVFWSKYDKNLNIKQNQPVYIFSSVFAPTNLEGTIYHEWSFFDETKKRWVQTDLIPISIVGGTDGGYRGFSLKRQTKSGLWRVDIQNKKGQIIGRIFFEIEKTDADVRLTKISR